jgi:hypothetical protein
VTTIPAVAKPASAGSSREGRLATAARQARGLWGRLCRLSPLAQDCAFYFVSAGFAAAVAIANTGDYHVWGLVALAPYSLAMATCGAGARLRLAAAAVARLRRAVVLFLLAATVLAPLGLLVVWRAEARPGPNAQPEVRVIEAAGDRLLAGHNPYLKDPRTVGVSPSSESRSVDTDSFFPYLPGMVPFGLTNRLPGPAELSDARLLLTGVTLVVAGAALVLCEAPRGRRGRALQVLVVLPTGAMPLATGGDDLPVLALMLLALVLAERRRSFLSGLAAGAAGSMKLTAWPLLLLLGAAERGPAGRRTFVRYAAAVASVVVPVVLLGLVPDPEAFVTNVVRFPLGLAGVNSPAASPLLGQVLTTLFPHLKREITVGLLLVGGVMVAALLVRYPPSTPAAASRLTGLALLIGTVLAPATRFGYLIYPANLMAWAYLLNGAEPARSAAGDAQAASSACTKSSSTRLVGAV